MEVLRCIRTYTLQTFIWFACYQFRRVLFPIVHPLSCFVVPYPVTIMLNLLLYRQFVFGGRKKYSSLYYAVFFHSRKLWKVLRIWLQERFETSFLLEKSFRNGNSFTFDATRPVLSRNETPYCYKWIRLRTKDVVVPWAGVSTAPFYLKNGMSWRKMLLHKVPFIWILKPTLSTNLSRSGDPFDR